MVRRCITPVLIEDDAQDEEVDFLAFPKVFYHGIIILQEYDIHHLTQVLQICLKRGDPADALYHLLNPPVLGEGSNYLHLLHTYIISGIRIPSAC